jgi:RNA polymerase sigma factor (sigma-70 family)
MPSQETTRSPVSSTGDCNFRTTHWSIVLAAGNAGEPKALDAMSKLCGAYWYPLYAYVRRRGYRVEEAQDLTQEFFGRLLEKNSLEVANRERGRFRTFLLAMMGNFLNNEWDRARTAKRGGGHELISWDAQTAEERYQQEPSHEETPERIFERRWALTVLESAMIALREEYRSGGKAELFEALQVCLSGERSTEPYAGLAARLGLSEGAVKVAVHRLRQRFGDALRLTIVQTLGRAEDVEQELTHLISMLGPGNE